MSSNSTRMGKRNSQWVRKFQSGELSLTKCSTLIARGRQRRWGGWGVEGKGREAERCLLNEQVADSHLPKGFLTSLRYKPLEAPCSRLCYPPKWPQPHRVPANSSPQGRSAHPAPARLRPEPSASPFSLLPGQNQGVLPACFPPSTPALASRSHRRR